MKTIQSVSNEEAAAFPPKLSTHQTTIAAMLADRPDCYLPKRSDLDKLSAGIPTEDELYEWGIAENWEWFDGFLEVLNWWRTIAAVALEGHNEGYEFGPNPAFAHHREELSRILMEVMVAYVPAEHETSPYTEDWKDFGCLTDTRKSTIELLKRYRVYTRYVESFVIEVWPDINRELLLNPDFGFLPMAA